MPPMVPKPPISLSEALRVLKATKPDGSKVPFSIRFVTLNKGKKNQPSRHIHIERAEECGAAHSLVKHGQVGVRALDGSMNHQVAVNLHLITHVNGRLVL